MRWLQFQSNPLKIITEGVEAGDGSGNTELVKGIQGHLGGSNSLHSRANKASQPIG